MFHLLFLTGFDFKPVILIPGHGGMTTNVTITEASKFSCCPELKNFPFWPPNETFALKYEDCMGMLLRAELDNATNKLKHPDGLEFVVEEFGDVSTLTAFPALVEYLVGKGYEVGKNLFGTPYDWLLYYAGLDDLFPKLKQFIENITESIGMKVILMGHSMGTHVERMLVKYCGDNWTQDHIDRIMLFSPAIYGCFGSFNMVVKGIFGSMGLQGDEVQRSARQMPSLHVLWDNYEVFKDDIVFQNIPNRPEGVKPNEVKDFLVSEGRFSEEAQKIFEFTEESLEEAPVEFPVKTFVMYNSGISTAVGYDVGNNWSFINGSGDGQCHNGGPKYICDNWNNIECYDHKSSDMNFSHSPMLAQRSSHDRIWRWMTDDEDRKRVGLIIGIVLTALGGLLVLVILVFMIVRKRRSKRNNYESIQ